MSNELYRKLTSITLMVIMFAGGMTVAMPGELPVAVAQTTSGTLSVSATGSFGGPQVIEIIVDDPNRADSDSQSPTVKINEEAVEMRQAATGKWYAYFADQSYSDLGTIATADEGTLLRDVPTLATRNTSWPSPIVQTQHDFDDGDTVEITAGRNEVATLTYEDSSTVTISSDRRDVPAGGQVHITISDFQLNLDPTATDVWTLNTDADATYDSVTTGTVNLWNDDVATLEVANPALTGGITSVTIEETGANTGVFESSTGIKVVDTANPGQSFSITYAGESQQIIVGDFSSTLELAADGAWDPREDLIVRVTDERLNLDTETDAAITTDSGDIPVVILGEPITLGTTNPTIISMSATDDRPTGTIDVNSAHVGTLIRNGAGTNIELTLTLSKDQVSQIMSTSSYIYYMGPAMPAFDHDNDGNTADATPGLDMDLPASTDGVTLTGASVVDNDGDAENGATITIRYDALETNAKNPIIFDIFTIGEYENDDGDTVTENNAIYRALLEETGSGSGVFEGTIKYQMLNQRTVNDPNAHGDITVLDKDLEIILDNGYTGTDGVTVKYGDKAVREDAPSHTGKISLDSETYGVADTVAITLADADLNTLSLVDIYTISATDDDLLDVGIINGCADQIGSISMRETASDSGVFEGTFDVPANCPRDSDVSKTGGGITVTYFDFRDASGAENEWTDSATIGANTGSIALDRIVYPVPGDDAVTIYIAVSDADVDKSSDSAETLSGGLVTVKVGGESFALTDDLEETSPDSGVFEISIGLDSTDEIEQGDIITVEYRDQSDASGSTSTAFDSATFDLRSAVLQSDKSTYVIGQNALITLIEPDLNLDSATIDSVDLDRIAWDSDAYDGSLDKSEARAALGPVPTNLRETGENTGIFQVVITIPKDIDNSALWRGEEITLTYIDMGPSGADFVGDDTRDVELQIKTSNFGATVKLDQNVYTWTDKVFITAVASDYNFDSNVIDEIGPEGDGEITIRVRGDGLKEYKLAETGPDTGVFTGEITLAGFSYDRIDYTAPGTSGSGPTDGTLSTNYEDGLSISFEYSDSEAPLVASALIRWNVGEVQWLEASYAATGSGIVRIIDPDMNTNPSAVDNIDDIVVYSETFLGGIELTVTETQEASGIFEGTVEFDPESASQGHRLQVTEGDIVTAEYDDYTLPPPDGEGDSLAISAATLIGSIVPPLERAPASNPAIVDAFNNVLASVSVDQQVQITADLTSGQDRDQDFAYLVQIQNEDGVTVQLTWLAGALGAGATFNAAQSWTPSETGSYTATMFVWESVSNPTALSPQLSITIDVV